MRDKYVGNFKQYLCNADGIQGKLAWLTLLHPKEFLQWLRQEQWNNSMPVVKRMKDDFEKEVCNIALRHEHKRMKTMDYLGKLLNAVEFLNQRDGRPTTSPQAKHNSLYGMYSPQEEPTLQQISEQQTTTIGSEEEFETKLRSTVNVQCSLFFQDLALDPHVYVGFKNFDLFQYWEKKKLSCKYYWVLKCAQKWLSVPSMSTPSERVWSICGVIDNPKRGCLDGFKLEAQAMINNNYHNLKAYHSKIEARTIELMNEKKKNKSSTTTMNTAPVIDIAGSDDDSDSD
jgi:hypothetical protein